MHMNASVWNNVIKASKTGGFLHLPVRWSKRVKRAGIRQFAFSIAVLVCLGHVAGHTSAQSLDQKVSELSKQITDGLTENQKQTIAVVEFVDLEGRVTNFGRFVAEELITRLYQTKKFKVIERQLLNKIVAEQKLSLGGMIDQSSAQKLGKLLGVDAIASGTITDLGKNLRINARLISTGTGEVFAVAATEIAKDDSVMTLMGASITGPTTTSSSVQSYQGNAIASKDIGSLRVVLKSMVRVKLPNRWGNMTVNGIRCSFEFINLETQRPIAVAMNAIAGGNAIGEYLRSTLVNENGELWRIKNSDVAGGISKVGVGILRYDPYYGSTSFYDPADIVTVLSKREDLNSDVLTHQQSGISYHFMFGSTTEMSPGQRLTVTMTFSQNEDQKNSDVPSRVFQMATEIVVGMVKTDTKKSYTLYNLTFDQVTMKAGA